MTDSGWGRKAPKTRSRNGDPGAAPSKDVLHEAALGYLARGSATGVTLTRVLDRKVANWARRAERASRDRELVSADVASCRELITALVERFREVGLVNDASFAATRVRTLSRAGRSRRAIAAHLASKGVDATTAREALPTDASAELAAALAFARKRRIGPFVRDDADRTGPEARSAEQKALATMARAGFPWSVCERALRMDREQAEERILESRRD